MPGRNDLCLCGSGKKYKKCCLAKDNEASMRQAAVIPPPTLSVASPFPASSVTQQRLSPAGASVSTHTDIPEAPPEPPDPVTERANHRWREFESQNGEGRIAVFLETLDDAEVMTDDLAYEMLGIIHKEATTDGRRTRFAECVGALRERLPEVFDQGAHYHLSWCLLDALAESRHEIVPALARELATRAGRDIDIVNRGIVALQYHGQLSVLVQAFRIAWPDVKSSERIVPWGISRFGGKGVDHEIFDYLEHTTSPRPDDPILLDRVQYFVENPREEYLRKFIEDLTANPGREWQAADFELKPLSKRSRDDWDDEPEEQPAPDQGAINLSRLINEFVGYLCREEGLPFPRGALIREELYRYFVCRHKGDLDPRPSMLESMSNPNRKLPKPPRPAHPLCPERVTLEVHLCELMGMMSGLYHTAAALFQAMPAWLRFLECRSLIDAATRTKVEWELRPLHSSLLRIWEQHTEDPFLYRQGKEWPGVR